MTPNEYRELEIEAAREIYPVHDFVSDVAFTKFNKRRERYTYPLIALLDPNRLPLLIKDASDPGTPWKPITDDNGGAEVKREIWRRGWQYAAGAYPDSTPEEDEPMPTACAQIIAWDAPPEKGNTFEVLESLSDHNGDPIRAEATALVRAFLAACRATGEGRKEGENG